MAGLMAEYIKRKNNYAMKKKKKKKNNYAMKYKNNITTAGTGTPLEPFSVPGRTEFADAGTDPGTTPGAPEETKPSSLSFEKKYPDGSVRLSYDYYLGENDEKIKHGKYSRNYSDGSLAGKGQFKDGKKVGVWEEYKDGKLVRTYEFGEEVDGRQKRINNVYYDEEGNPRDLDKEKSDRDWENRTNFINIRAMGGGARIDLAKLSDEELTKRIASLLEDTPGKQSLSGATKGWMDAQINKFREEVQIRKDAGRWGGDAVDEYIERIR